MSVTVDRNNLNRKVFALNDFRGVDYASSPLEVKPYRATDMANLLLRDGMLKKRNGFRQVHKINGEVVKVFNVRANTILAQVYEGDTTIFRSYLIGTDAAGIMDVGHTVNKRVKAGNGVAVGDKYYIYVPDYEILQFDQDGRFEKVLTEADYYAPTTTINIPLTRIVPSTSTEPSYIATDDNIVYPSQSYESINMLTPIRKNRFKVRADLSPFADATSNLLFELDGVCYGNTDAYGFGNYEITAPFTPILTIEGTQVGTFAYSGGAWTNSTAGLSIMTFASGIRKTNKPALVVTNSEQFKTKLNQYQSSADGYVTMEITYKEKNTIVALSEQVRNEQMNGMERFPSEKMKILNSSCITTFGVDGADDRIFVGGSDKAPNIVYFTENDTNLKANPTYFPVDQFLSCGTPVAPVTSFLRVTDGTLAILKRTTDATDVAVYYTSGTYNELRDDEIGNVYYEARFNVKAGDIGRRGISPNAIANLDGDNIFTSAEGVYGIQLSSNVASGERYAKERSRTINPKISKMGLHNAKGIVFEDKYYLAVDGGEVYVADARYKFTLKGDQQNTFNYEWFRLTDLYVKEWFVLYDRLYFIDKNGYICAFTERYADEYMRVTDRGELTVNDGSVTFIADEDLELVETSAFAVDDQGRTWELKVTEHEGKPAIAIPDDINIQAGDTLTLWFCKPINAYWQSSVLALDNAMMRKNMWSMSMTVNAEQGGRVDLGYKTRFTHKEGIEVQGVNTSGVDFGDMNFIGGNIAGKGFDMFTFDSGAGYIGINTFRCRAFERGFTNIQLLFNSATTFDCAVCEIDIEYSITNKTIGVG